MTMTEKKIGKITHYYNHLHVATVNITNGELQIGDMIHVEGHTSNFMQKLCSMELEHESTDVAKPGDNVGIAIDEYARENDSVYVVH
jgi:translation elongation factor EF-1alpha